MATLCFGDMAGLKTVVSVGFAEGPMNIPNISQQTLQQHSLLLIQHERNHITWKIRQNR